MPVSLELLKSQEDGYGLMFAGMKMYSVRCEILNFYALFKYIIL